MKIYEEESSNQLCMYVCATKVLNNQEYYEAQYPGCCLAFLKTFQNSKFIFKLGCIELDVFFSNFSSTIICSIESHFTLIAPSNNLFRIYDLFYSNCFLVFNLLHQ